MFGALIPLASAAFSLFGANKAQKQADKLNKQQLQFATNRWNAGQPLRDLALQKLQSTQRPDLTNIYQNPQNPFANNRAAPSPMPVVGGLAPQAAQPPAPVTAGGGGNVGDMVRNSINAIRARRMV